jgi:uncharacterized protein YkwD
MARLAWLISTAMLVITITPGRTHAGVPDARTNDLATLINRARVEHGAQPLARSSELDSAADAHSQDMLVHDYLDHTGSDGSTPQERAERAGYRVPRQSGWIVVEVISAISGDPAGPLDWWLNQSPEVHGKALLDPRWREMGVGYAAGGEFGNYWTVLVGCRPGVLPLVQLDGRTFESMEKCGDANAIPTLSAIQTGNDLEVRWAGIASPNERDWFGLYRPADAETAYLAWAYVSCAWMPLMPRDTGWCWLKVPPDLTDGSVEVRLYANNEYRRMAISEPITLTRP